MLIAIAGYVTYDRKIDGGSGNEIQTAANTDEDAKEASIQEEGLKTDISDEEELAWASTEDVENPGETVLTSAIGDSDYAAKVKLNREQVRSKNKETLQAIVAPLEVGKADQDYSCLKNLYSRKDVFGLDLYEAGFGEQIEGMVKELFAGKGAVRQTLHKYVAAR